MSDFEQADKATPSPAPLPQWRQPPGKLPDADEALKRRGTPSPADRIARFPGAVELGDQVVDSLHPYPIATPKVSSDAPPVLHAIVSIDAAPALTSGRDDKSGARRRAEAFSPTAGTHAVLDGVPIPVQFWPRFVGDHEANVKILLQWNDDVQDLRTIRVHGHARRLADAPTDALGVTVGPRDRSKDPAIPTADPKHVEPVHIQALDNSYQAAKTQAGSLANSLKSGLHLAEKTCLSYKKQPPERPWWAALGELAINMAIGGVASVAAKVIGASIHSRFGRLLPPKDSVQDLSEAFWIDAVKEGLKWAGKKAFLEKGADSGSVEGQIAFFSQQDTILNATIGTNGEFVDNENRRLQHLLIRSPAHAIAIMHSLRESLFAASQEAKSLQRFATETQWISLVGRSENGTEIVAVNGDTRQTTNLRQAGRVTDGILRINANRDGSVTGASMMGVARMVARNLREQDLSRAPIPLVILRDDMFITRDEVGRVRTPWKPDTEAQNHREATEFCNHVLSKSLAKWGVAEIETDDATGKKGS